MKLSRKLVRNGDQIFWWCPGCEYAHSVRALGSSRLWDWNGDVERPTFSPSVASHGTIHCHCFVRNGTIEFLSDCDHRLAGQKVGIPDWPFGEENETSVSTMPNG